MREVQNKVKEAARQYVTVLEKHFGADCVYFYGPIFPSCEKHFRLLIEATKKSNKIPRDKLVVFLNTPGGSAETVEKLVDIIRYHYDEVFFVVPDEAMSAGTIFCMS